MTRVIRIHETGGPDALRLEQVTLGDPGPGQVLLRHTAIGINYIDTYHRSGLYPVPLPSGLGMEAAGLVEAVGDGVNEVAVGDRVAYAGAAPGAYADARLIEADRLISLPDSIDDETAAALLLKGMTVEYLIRRCCPVKRGQTVLWHAAAGGVGLIACQWLAHLGVRVIGTVSSENKAQRAKAHGAWQTIVYTQEDFADMVRELTQGVGVPAVFDSVGKDTFEGSLDCLEPRGMLVGFGNASGKPPPIDMGILAQKGSLYLTRPTLMTYTKKRQDLLSSAEALFEVVASGAVKVEISQRWPLAEAGDAHRALEARRTTGSSLLIPER
jgi:NADPH:quinone reductase